MPLEQTELNDIRPDVKGYSTKMNGFGIKDKNKNHITSSMAFVMSFASARNFKFYCISIW